MNAKRARKLRKICDFHNNQETKYVSYAGFRIMLLDDKCPKYQYRFMKANEKGKQFRLGLDAETIARRAEFEKRFSQEEVTSES